MNLCGSQEEHASYVKAEGADALMLLLNEANHIYEVVPAPTTTQSNAYRDRMREMSQADTKGPDRSPR